MYTFKTKKGIIKEDVDFEDPNYEELYYWRKHPNLHGWMEKLYYKKGGTNPVFNCVNVKITEKDLDRLETVVLSDELPETVGFFFGKSYPENKKSDLDFITKARQAIKEGYDVYYTSWW